MTKEEAKKFEEALESIIDSMTGTIDDEPRYQLTGKIIPPELRRAEPEEE